jgi:hypothetical protein
VETTRNGSGKALKTLGEQRRPLGKKKHEQKALCQVYFVGYSVKALPMLKSQKRKALAK